MLVNCYSFDAHDEKSPLAHSNPLRFHCWRNFDPLFLARVQVSAVLDLHMSRREYFFKLPFHLST